MRITLIILVVILNGCDGGNTVTPDTRPAFILDPSNPFVIELGRGSGWNGLDIVKVQETGAVQITRFEGRPMTETASLQLSSADVATLIGLVNTNHLTKMGRMYSNPHIHEGTQWVLWIEQSQSQKAIYFNNSFPNQIIEFRNGLDALLQKAGLATAKWTELPAPQADAQQKTLWARIE